MSHSGLQIESAFRISNSYIKFLDFFGKSVLELIRIRHIRGVLSTMIQNNRTHVIYTLASCAGEARQRPKPPLDPSAGRSRPYLRESAAALYVLGPTAALHVRGPVCPNMSAALSIRSSLCHMSSPDTVVKALTWSTEIILTFPTARKLAHNSHACLANGLNNALSFEYQSVANLSTTWINNPTINISSYDDDEGFRSITPVLSQPNTSQFISGFYCFPNETSCFFGVVIFAYRSKYSGNVIGPQLVWSAHPDSPVKVNATLKLMGNGNLILEDADGYMVWSTNTGGKSVTVLRFTETGNLVLFDRNNVTVWQSFDNPTNCLVLGQKLVTGQKLIASSSLSDLSRGLYSLYVEYFSGQGYYALYGSFEANPPFMRLETDGHLKVYEWDGFSDGVLWKTVADLLTSGLSDDECGYPMPFEKARARLEDCKNACLRNCSCKAAVFTDASSDSVLTRESSNQTVITANRFSSKKSRSGTIILGSSLGAFLGVCLLVGTCIFVFKMKREREELDDEFSIAEVPGMPTRFSYDDLKTATNDFNKKLGEGGFGSVFQGTLSDGTEVAVKRLAGLSQIKKSFLAEVQTIGSIHHVNLVRLIGFCAENSIRLLVYEYMSNRSLDRWISKRHQELTLGWESRRKIIADIAKGLAYLHEECRQKIYHLDIKPQNVLLDENFEAKVSDFGLAKLIDKDQSHVVATLGGTPGYMAPEWLSSIITEKVDVYSFGVVVLEILCGRKNVDRSLPEKEMHLVALFERKGEEGQLLDMVDKHNADMQLHKAEVVEMMKLVVWCLQSDYHRRPSMTVVVQLLEGLVSVQDNLDYNFINAPATRTKAATGEEMDSNIHDGTPLFAFDLSGPRKISNSTGTSKETKACGACPLQ
ncbi:hypothetical protein RHSIM_Rhsim06G0122900 [Rhododendron simsii]|uniref:non-specific serine/threonine protein kinase n=1 Tax=Rhododendron simsii TaxID=118357 RepID=A0A834GTF2_RHOSS|nr:hypothetical protein RHSIM_Rhsim06G0122900 [Rhododendron simsii]